MHLRDLGRKLPRHEENVPGVNVDYLGLVSLCRVNDPAGPEYFILNKIFKSGTPLNCNHGDHSAT